MEKSFFMRVNSISSGFIDIPDEISLNIYAQGCEKRCEGCQNEDLMAFSGGAKLYISDVDKLLSDYSLCDWVCWLGGDAVYQEEALIKFNNEFKDRNLKIALYTGKTFDELSGDILDGVDLVIDGEWNGVPVTEPGTNQHIWSKCGSEWTLVNNWTCLSLLHKDINTEG